MGPRNMPKITAETLEQITAETLEQIYNAMASAMLKPQVLLLFVLMLLYLTTTRVTFSKIFLCMGVRN